MSEPLRTPADSVPSCGPQHDALIEQLLLAGLDHYFDGQYEQAVNVWTRVAFLERSHGRARAYIERARAALAERHRQADELLHRGIEAYEAGDLAVARDLLSRAVASGSANETALVFLQRLGRVQALDVVEASRDTPAARSWSAAERPARVRGDDVVSGARPSWMMTVVVSVVLAAAILFAAQPIASWLGERPVAARPAAVRPADPPPIVRASDISLARARARFASGRHHEALAALDTIGIADPQRAEADRLRGEIQRALLDGVTPALEAEARP